MQRRTNRVEPPLQPAQSALPGLTLMVAREGLRSTALDFRRRIFEKEQGTDGLDDFDEHAVQLVACVDGLIVAAARFIDPEQRPFGLERYFDLSAHVAHEEWVGELSRYCLREDWRDIRRGTLVHFGMFKLVLEYARERGISSVVCSMQPRFQALYRRMYFRAIGPTFYHPVFGHTMVMMLGLSNVWSNQSGLKHPLRALLRDPRIPSVSL
jgi:N-acyl-L-homoserine lactone synthetase